MKILVRYSQRGWIQLRSMRSGPRSTWKVNKPLHFKEGCDCTMVHNVFIKDHREGEGIILLFWSNHCGQFQNLLGPGWRVKETRCWSASSTSTSSSTGTTFSELISPRCSRSYREIKDTFRNMQLPQNLHQIGIARWHHLKYLHHPAKAPTRLAVAAMDSNQETAIKK